MSFVRVDVRLLRHAQALGLTDHTLRLVLALLASDWRNGRPVCPSQALLAELCGCDERGVRTRWAALEERGLAGGADGAALVTRRRAGRRGRFFYDLTNLYARLDELPAERREVAGLPVEPERREVAGLDGRQTGEYLQPDRRVVAGSERRVVAGDVDAVDVDAVDVDALSARATTNAATIERLCELTAELANARAKGGSYRVDDDGRAAMRELLAQREAIDVEAAIRWADAETFWRGRIATPAELRRHFDRLVAQAGSRTGGSSETDARQERQRRRAADIAEGAT